MGVRSPFGSHVAERLLDALGRHAADGDAEASATAEQVRRILQGTACTAAWLRLDPVRQIIRCHQCVGTWLRRATPCVAPQGNHAAEGVAKAWQLQSRCDAYASRHGHPTACGPCKPLFSSCVRPTHGEECLYCHSLRTSNVVPAQKSLRVCLAKNGCLIIQYQVLASVRAHLLDHAAHRSASRRRGACSACSLGPTVLTATAKKQLKVPWLLKNE